MVREHEEFVWLHDRYVENEEYAGIIVSKIPIPGLVNNLYINRVFINRLINITKVLYYTFSKNKKQFYLLPTVSQHTFAT